MRRALVAWRTRCLVLGPASTPRTLLEAAAVPLCAALGLESPAAVEPANPGLAATLRANGRAGGAARDALGRGARSALAARGHAGSAARRAVVPPLRRPALAGRRRRARLRAGGIWSSISISRSIIRTSSPRSLRSSAHRALSVESADERSLHALVAASDRHAAGVCRSLRDGVLAASGEVLQALVFRTATSRAHAATTRIRARRSVDLDVAFEQALTIVYRILFLLFAEARALVPLWHPIYRESYSLEALRDIAERDRTGLGPVGRAARDRAPGACGLPRRRSARDAVQRPAVRAGAHAARRAARSGRRRGQKAVLALSTRPAPDRGGPRAHRLPRPRRRAARALCTRRCSTTSRSIDGRQSLARGRRRASARRPARSTRRSRIADYLVRRTLGPLVRDAAPERHPAAAGRRSGDGQRRVSRGGVPVPGERIRGGAGAIRRTVTRATSATQSGPASGAPSPSAACTASISTRWRCSSRGCRCGWPRWPPTAAELSRPSSAGRRQPARRVARQSSPAAEPRAIAPPAQPLPLFDDDANRRGAAQALPVRFALEAMPDDTLEQVQAKERTFAALTGAIGGALAMEAGRRPVVRGVVRARRRCCACVRVRRACPTQILTGRSALPPKTASRYLDAAEETSRRRRLFHWELEFPEVFFDRDGHAIAARRLRRRDRQSAVGHDSRRRRRRPIARSRARADIAPVLRFTRDAGVYQSQSDGHANRYQLFVERAIALTRAGGRFGLVLPVRPRDRPRQRAAAPTPASPSATSTRSSAWRTIAASSRFIAASGFLLLTATQGSPTRCDRVPARRRRSGRRWHRSATSRRTPRRGFRCASRRRCSNGCPARASCCRDLRTPADLAIVERAAALFPPLGSAAGWSARFGRELNASDDRGAFRDGGHGLPVVDGKHLEPFHVALERVNRTITAADARRLLRSDRHARPRLAYRDVASATNRLTLIAAVLPAGCVSTHTVFCLRTPLPPRDQHFLCGLFNSFVVNYLVRLRVTTHVTTAAVEQLPDPNPRGRTGRRSRDRRAGAVAVSTRRSGGAGER